MLTAGKCFVVFTAVVSLLLIMGCNVRAAEKRPTVHEYSKKLCRPEKKMFDESPFGLHAVQGAMQEASEAGASWKRQRVLWEQGEPKQGRYNFAPLDTIVEKADSYNIRHVITIRPISSWGGAYPLPRGGKPKDLVSGYPQKISAWLKFVNEVVERYDGDGIKDMPGLKNPIKYFQIENEFMWQWKGTEKEYVELLSETYDEIKNANPDAELILGAFGGLAMAMEAGFAHKNHLEVGIANMRRVPLNRVFSSKKYITGKKKLEYILEKAWPYFDVMDLHSYTDDPYDIVPPVCWLKNKMKAYGSSKKIFSLENSGPFHDFSDEKFSESIIKRYIIGMSYGIDKIFWSSLKPTLGWSENYLRLSLLDNENRKKDAFYTYKFMTKKLKGIKSLRPEIFNENIKVFSAKLQNGQDLYIAWSDKGDISWTLPEVVKEITITQAVLNRQSFEPKTEKISASGRAVIIPISSPVFIEVIR